MFALPQDVSLISIDHLREVLSPWDRPTLCVAGCCCQDLSVAGSGAGLQGERSGTFHDLHRVLIYAQAILPPGRFAYILENTACQFDWKHRAPREDFLYLNKILDQPVVKDAGQFGYAR